MDFPPNKTDELERRLSTRNSLRISVISADEDPELAAMGMVADGFRPVNSGPEIQPPSTPSLASGSSTLLGDGSPESARIGRSPSISKPPRPRDASSTRQHGGPEQADESSSLSRQLSGSTESTAYLAPESPYRGPSGPSHPYQMYPQNVRMARTMSTTTTSSTLPASELSYTGPRGPSHPYGLYPQSDGVETGAMPDTVPLGFHGLPDQYRRRVGADGEEAGDIIGPDGHTEQLPPYTRYPDEAYARKVAAADASTPTGVAQATTNTPNTAAAAVTAPPSITTSGSTIVGAGGLGLATRNPEFDSTDDLGSPQSRHSSRSFTSDSTNRVIKPYEEVVNEKGQSPKGWKLWMRRKLCGIVPYWVICLTFLILLVVGAILGSVIGTFLSKQKRPMRKDGTWSPFNSPAPVPTFGAVPIPKPADLQPLPVGTFSMPLTTNRVSNTCFQDPTLSQAWNCFLVIAGLHLTIAENHGEHSMMLNFNHSFTLMNNVYSYGEQPPLVEKPVTLTLVNDTFEPTRGPAFYNMLTYDKTVILPEAALSPTTPSVTRRNIRNLAGMTDFKRKNIAKVGDKPWVCRWPDTYLEMFIYPHQNSSWSGIPPLSAGGPGGGPGSPGRGPYQSFLTSTTTTFFESSSATLLTQTSPPGETPPPQTSTLPAPIGGENSNNQPPAPEGNQSPPPPPPPPSEGPSPTNTNKPKGYWPEPRDSKTLEFPPFPTSTGGFGSGSGWGPIDENFTPPPPGYPRVIKLAERRVPTITTGTAAARVPECTQMEITGYAQEAKVVVDGKGKAVTIRIVENEQTVVGPFGGAGRPGGQKRRRKREGEERAGREGGGTEEGVFTQQGGGPPAADMSPCGCMWFVT
ncbi:hypothetical protein QC762_408330 [Podospora pseudocomata]|uniref:DUF7820 domain-containing protein n=1 Tax=Podospora pseudocomata TaxID=2093779 RepID=A0ABR0GGD4_9PEZI|nr:hypothetical protein QC762_408330 [Podospora pseudocomata]